MLPVNSRRLVVSQTFSDSAPGYLDLEDLKNLKRGQKGYISRLVERVIQFIAPNNKRRANVLMQKLLGDISSDRPNPFERTLTLFKELKSCAADRDKKRFSVKYDDANGRLTYIIDLRKHSEEAGGAEAAARAAGAASEPEQESTDEFSYSINIASDEWERIKSGHPDLFSGHDSVSDQDAAQSAQSTAGCHNRTAPAAVPSDSVCVSSEPITAAAQGGHLSLTEDPLKPELSQLLDAFAEHDDQKDAVTALREKLAILDRLRARIKPDERERIDVKFDGGRFTLSVNRYKNLPWLRREARTACAGLPKLSKSPEMFRASSECNQQTVTWKSASVNRAQVLKLVEDGVIEGGRIRGWQDSNTFFKEAIQQQFSLLSLEYSGDLDEVEHENREVNAVRAQKIELYVRAISTIDQLPEVIAVIKGEFGWQEFSGKELTEKVIARLEELKVEYIFKKIPETDSETAQAVDEEYLDDGIVSKRLVYQENITQQVLEGVRAGIQHGA